PPFLPTPLPSPTLFRSVIKRGSLARLDNRVGFHRGRRRRRHSGVRTRQSSRHRSQRRPGRPGSDIGKESPPRQIFSCHSYLLLRSEEHTSELQSHLNLV